MHTSKYSYIEHDILYMPSSPLDHELSTAINIHILARHTQHLPTPINPHRANKGTISDSANTPMPRVLRALTHSYCSLSYVSGSQTARHVQQTPNRESSHFSHLGMGTETRYLIGLGAKL